MKEINIVDHSRYFDANGYYVFIDETPVMPLCDQCAKENYSLEQLNTANFSPLGQDGETDSPTHCELCEALIVEPLTPYGIEYVRDAIAANDGRPEILAAWKMAYHYYLETEND